MSLSFWDDDAFAADVLAAQAEYEDRCRSGRKVTRRASRPAEARGAYVQGVRPNDRPSRSNWAWDDRKVSR